MSGTDRLNRLADVLADRTVLPGYSRFGYRLRRRHWPADPPPDALAGRTAVVTGASSGLGRATALGLARLGATVLLLVRDETRGERARDAVLQTVPQADVHIARCDIADLDDVDRCAQQVRRDHPVIDVLVHNAGVLPEERTETPQSHESTLATHVLGPMRLTERLRTALARSTDARVLLVSSGGMYTQSIAADDLEYRHGRYRGAAAYSRTKRLQVAFTPLLSRRYAAEGVGVHSLHPGWVDTPGLTGSLPGFHRLVAPLLRSPAEGADTAIWLAATRPAPRSGLFWHDRRPRPDHYLPGRGDDPRTVRRAWHHCLEAAGIGRAGED